MGLRPGTSLARAFGTVQAPLLVASLTVVVPVQASSIDIYTEPATIAPSGTAVMTHHLPGHERHLRGTIAVGELSFTLIQVLLSCQKTLLPLLEKNLLALQLRRGVLQATLDIGLDHQLHLLALRARGQGHD